MHFWDFELKGGKTLHAVHVRTLQMEDDVMVVRYDPKYALCIFLCPALCVVSPFFL